MSLQKRMLPTWKAADGFPLDEDALNNMMNTLLNMEAMGLLLSNGPAIILNPNTDAVPAIPPAVNNMLIYAAGRVYGLQGGEPLAYIQLVSNTVNGVFTPLVGPTVNASIEVDSYFAFTAEPITGEGAPLYYPWSQVQTLPTLADLNETVIEQGDIIEELVSEVATLEPISALFKQTVSDGDGQNIDNAGETLLTLPASTINSATLTLRVTGDVAVTSAGGTFTFYIRKNGNNLRSCQIEIPGTANFRVCIAMETISAIAVGDVITILGIASPSGATATVYNIQLVAECFDAH